MHWIIICMLCKISAHHQQSEIDVWKWCFQTMRFNFLSLCMCVAMDSWMQFYWNWQAFGYDVRLTIAQKCVFSKPFMSLCKQPLTCQRLCGMRSLKIVFAIKSDYRCWHKHTLHKSNAICPEWVRLRIQEIINGQVWVAPTLLCKSAVFANIATSSCG